MDRASAWACAAIERNPCGPLSQRHQISGPSAGSDRKIVIPASSKCHGRLADRSGSGRRRPGRQERAGHARLRWRPPLGGAEERLPEGEERLPAVALGGSDHQGPALVAVTLTRRPESAVQAGRDYIEHAAQGPPGRVGQRAPGAVGFDSRDQAQLCDQAVIVEGQLAVHPAGEGIVGELLLEQAG